LEPALTALSAVSAVLWTGGLIILQLRSVDASINLGDPEEVRNYTRRTSAIKGALACIAYSMLAPVYILFIAGPLVRIGALGFFVLYALLTWRHVPRVLAFVKLDLSDRVSSGLFLLPTLAMLVVGLFPTAAAIAWSSGLLLFCGFFVLSDSLYTLKG
jgi:hypothetical protein